MTGKGMYRLVAGIGFCVVFWMIGPSYGSLIDTFDPPNPNVTATQSGSAPGPQVLAGGPSGNIFG